MAGLNRHVAQGSRRGHAGYITVLIQYWFSTIVMQMTMPFDRGLSLPVWTDLKCGRPLR